MIKNIKRRLFSERRVDRIGLWGKISRCFSSEQISGKNYISKLDSRSLLVMHGPETYKLLQGLTTNDMNLLSSKPLKSKRLQNQPPANPSTDRVSLYTLFLSPKGKLITDAFIYKPKMYQNGKRQFRQDQLWIDVHSSAKKDLFMHLRKYMWKKQVELVDIDAEPDEHKPTVYAGYNHISTISGPLEQGSEVQMKSQEVREEEYANLMMFDPRGGNFGRRILCMQEEFGISSTDFKLMPETMYEDYERAIGFTPIALARNKLPFQFNYDFLNAISFKKGCYLGQQIVSRSYFTGIVRRRVFPFMLDNKCRLTESQHNQIKQGTKLLNENKEEIGKVIYYEKDKTGLVLASYLNYFPETTPSPETDKISESQNISESQMAAKAMLSVKITAPFQGAMYCPFQQTLQSYLAQTRSKQKSLEELDI